MKCTQQLDWSADHIESQTLWVEMNYTIFPIHWKRDSILLHFDQKVSSLAQRAQFFSQSTELILQAHSPFAGLSSKQSSVSQWKLNKSLYSELILSPCDVMPLRLIPLSLSFSFLWPFVGEVKSIWEDDIYILREVWFSLGSYWQPPSSYC